MALKIESFKITEIKITEGTTVRYGTESLTAAELDLAQALVENIILPAVEQAIH